MKVSVCAPSYRRPKVESFKYLPFLKVFVDEGEYEDYCNANVKFKENIVSVPKGIQGNLCRIRNYILDEEFKNGADVVCIIDDDLKGMYRYDVDKDTKYGYVKCMIKAEEFIDWIEYWTSICYEAGFKMWGVNVNSDALSYRHYTPLSFTSYIGGPFSCHLKESEIRYDENLPLKEDYDITLQHLNKYRGVLRVNYCFYDCKQSEQAGGCATYRSLQREKEQFDLLQKKWGSKIVRYDDGKRAGSIKKKNFDYNPIIKVPIKGV